MKVWGPSRVRGAHQRGAAWLLSLLAWATVVMGAVACSETLPYVWVQELPPAKQTSTETVAPGDTLSVFVSGQESLSGEFPVRSDGTIAQPLLGSVKVAGQTPEAVAADLRRRFTGMVVDPAVTVAIAQRGSIGVGVVGEVNTPGHFAVAADEGVLSVLARAGGLNDFADEDEIYVVRRIPEPQRIRFRFADLARPETAATHFRLMDGDTVVVE